MANQRSAVIATRLLIIGAVLIFVNTMLIAANGAPIIISSYPISSVEDIAPEVVPITEDILYKPFWGRMSLGIRGLVEGVLMLFWIILAVTNLFLSILLYLRPTKLELPSFFILILSFLSIFTGGGFVIGLILGIIGSSMGLQWRMAPGETFFGKLFRAARLDSKLYKMVKENPKTLTESALLIIFVNVLSGLGSALYTFNMDKILHSSSQEIPFRILLLGEVFFDLSVLNSPLIFIGIAIIKWLALSLLIYVVGVKLTGLASEFNEIARTIAFAYAPISLQIFLPLLFLNEPFLTNQWPMAVFFVTNFWMIFALVVAVRQSLDVPTRRAMGIAMFTGTIYWLVVYKMAFPMIEILNPTFQIPGILLDFGPIEFVLALASCSVILSILFGAFKRR